MPDMVFFDRQSIEERNAARVCDSSASLAKRAAVALIAAMLVFSFQVIASDSAAAAESKSDSSSSSLSAGKKNGKEEKAEKKRDEAKKLFSQADALSATITTARAEYDAAMRERDAAIAERDDANRRLEDERKQLETLQNELSDFAVDMYKQGGVTPYLDVVLRSTSYQEYLTSWSTLVSVYEEGEAKANEKRAIQKEIEDEMAACEERISQADRAIAVTDSKCRQLEASQLALNAQAWDLMVEAAEITGDKDEVAKAKEEAKAAHKALDDAVAAGLAGESLLVGDGFFTHPCPDSTISSRFGYRDFDHSVHKGIDFSAAEGTPFYAAESGTVTAVTNGGGYNGGAGNWIVIDHGDGFTTKYMHALVTFVSVGDHVERGQNIGLVGTTGNSTGPHLHFQVESNGSAIDPAVCL